MRNQGTFGDKLTNWKLIRTNLAPHLQEMPHLQPIATELEALITEAEAHDAEQEVARGRLRDLSLKRREIERRGQGLRSRAAAHLRGTFGYKSQELVQFGLTPLKTPRKRKAPPAVEPPAPATAAK